jgi:hypothetical protein
VVDQHCLLPQPQRPAVLTNLLDDALTDSARERRPLERGLLQAASDTRDLGHNAGLLISKI